LGRTRKPGRAGSSEAVSCTRRPASSVAMGNVGCAVIWVLWHAVRGHLRALSHAGFARICRFSDANLVLGEPFWLRFVVTIRRAYRETQIGSGELACRALDNTQHDEHLFSEPCLLQHLQGPISDLMSSKSTIFLETSLKIDEDQIHFGVPSNISQFDIFV